MEISRNWRKICGIATKNTTDLNCSVESRKSSQVESVGGLRRELLGAWHVHGCFLVQALNQFWVRARLYWEW